MHQLVVVSRQKGTDITFLFTELQGSSSGGTGATGRHGTPSASLGCGGGRLRKCMQHAATGFASMHTNAHIAPGSEQSPNLCRSFDERRATAALSLSAPEAQLPSRSALCRAQVRQQHLVNLEALAREQLLRHDWGALPASLAALLSAQARGILLFCTGAVVPQHRCFVSCRL